MKATSLIAAVVLGLGAAALMFGLALLMAFPTMWIMNYLFTPAVLAAVFGVSQLTFWKAFVLNLFFGFVVGRGTSSSNKKD